MNKAQRQIFWDLLFFQDSNSAITVCTTFTREETIVQYSGENIFLQVETIEYIASTPIIHTQIN